MISKNQVKLIRALSQKKQRKLQQLFLVQGEKNVLELLNTNLVIKHLFGTPEFIKNNAVQLNAQPIIEADESALAKASTLVSNNAAIAVVEMPALPALPQEGLILALDGVSDPGNLGTIIRVADWYGISTVVASLDCADPYNPKTISATMGSFGRVNVVQTELETYLKEINLPIYGAYLGGESVHQSKFTDNMVLVMGSESHGIRGNISEFINHKITIPGFGHAESLNVAMASGIILDNIKRTQTKG